MMMMMEGTSSRMERADLIDLVFSWSLQDLQLNRNQVGKIPKSFQSVEQYLTSFVSPLLEETRAELWSSVKDISSAPFATVISVNESRRDGAALYHNVKVDHLRNINEDDDKEPYRALPGDIIVLSEAKPKYLSDLRGVERKTWTLGYVIQISGGNYAHFEVKTSNDLEPAWMHKSLYIVFLMNITTTQRIWKALHKPKNLEVINKVLCTDSAVEEICNQCSVEMRENWPEKLGLSSKLNKSQYKAVVACVSKTLCKHKSFVELIWGPPGTGKTRTLSMLLWTLLHLKCRTLTCAPTNVAITEVASRVLRLVKESSSLCLGDILLFGNKDRLRVANSDFEEIYLEYRIEKFAECFDWKSCFTSMIEFLEDPVLHYQNLCHNDLINEKESSKENEDNKVEGESFLEFVRDHFKSIASPLRRCVSIFRTHVSKIFIKELNLKKMVSLADSLDSFESLLDQDNLDSEEFKVLFSDPKMAYSASQTSSDTPTVLYVRNECLYALKTLRCSLDELKLPNAMKKDEIEDFCFKMASSIFCTASSSYKLHSKKMEPLQLLVIDEAAQLKECESIIPLQLPGIRHAILIGDQCQLPALVKSNVSKEAGFGRSLFERLNHSKYLLNTQYRMHPSISFFPNSKFYQNQIMDAPCVRRKNYEKCYLQEPIFGPYSFLNISDGDEARKVGHSWKNMVEVAVVMKIVEMLYKACNASEEKLSIGVVSPYDAQVAEIQQKLGHKYEDHGSFSLKVKSIDGFQGGEEDIIILSTVISKSGGSIEFISCPHRTNVALTRARHCLWILGNERTLTNSESVWKELIFEAKDRHCFFDAGDNKYLAGIILKVKKDLDQLDQLLKADSSLFRSAMWKIRFNDNFRKSFVKLKSSETKNSVIFLLSELSRGKRPKGISVDIVCERTSHTLKQFRVGRLYVVCSIDIDKESSFFQVLTVWDIMPLEDIQKLVKRLDSIFQTYTHDYLNYCKLKRMDGKLEVPMSWPISSNIVQYKDINKANKGKDPSVGSFDEKDHSKVSDCLLLLKFYAWSPNLVRHLLSSSDGRGLGPSFELSDQQKEIILYNKTSFILGRSGTGKTAILTRKLFQNEQLCHITSEGLDADTVSWRCKASESDDGTKGTILHQIFVTVSPKLCHAVKREVSQLRSFECDGNSSAERSSIHMDDIDDTAEFADIPDSFVDLPPRSYPLVITFHKFLMMLDGTVGTSYFERFPDLRKLCYGKISNSRSVTLETLIRTKEVNYDRFSSSYWPHFNEQLTKKLDCSSVFTEIMSVIKGDFQAGEARDGKLCPEEYVSLSDGRWSTSSRKREIIYDIFLQYEKRKAANGDFDLADLVIDLHFRLKDKGYKGDEMHFVYIDEVQDLSMRQIALFKYICRNVHEGFVFAGDTAQTIARGIDFCFEDIRCLFYKEFLLRLKGDVTDERKEKGQISDIFHLSQNFRTHAGILQLAQSVVDLLYHFFPSSIDKLSRENSCLSGQAPILLESKDNEDVTITIFENSGNGGNVVSFGAEQVILVRDDDLRKSISPHIGKKALVLTILECKGLEFQDVLLYNFFSSSPFKNQWRVIYEYMKEKNLLDCSSPRSFPSFNQENHNLLCTELKQLYVAITRTKQRLWICENEDEYSQPMFDCWKKLHLVQVRQLDDLFAKDLQVASSQEEWKSQGIKFFHEHMYKMAMMCFERAGDRDWERLAEAHEFRAKGDRMRGPNPEISHNYLSKAGEIFDSIGKAELAAQCYFVINEYKKAGEIYSRDSKLEKAGECFSLAGCHKLAAEVYGKAKLYSQCLIACTDGKLFDLGLKYIKSWEGAQDRAYDADKVIEMEKAAHDFLHSTALYYYKLKDNITMMKFVKFFHTIELIRTFLNGLDCIDELLLLEKERGNFMEAANIAQKKGDLLLEADLVEKTGLFREASMLILWHAFSRYGTLELLKQKDELLTRAKSIAKNHSDHFYDFVSKEAEILSEERANEEVLDMRLVQLQFLQYWKQNAPTDVGRVKKSYEINIIEKKLLKEATSIAEQKGNLLLKADLLEKAGDFKEASMVRLWYAFPSSLWVSNESEGWPLKNFNQKEELLKMAKACAKNFSDPFYEFVCMEANILSNRDSSLSEMMQNMVASRRLESLRGEILSARKILDVHLISNTTKYEWNKVLVSDLIQHSEDLISQNRVTIETLIYFWNFWKGEIVKIIDSLRFIREQDGGEDTCYQNFCLNYMGVRKHGDNEKAIYLFLFPGANFLRNKNDAEKFLSVARRYWRSEINSVGLKVLKTLRTLYDYSVENSFPMFHQTISIIRIFEVATFCQEYYFVDHRHKGGPVQEYIELSCKHFFGIIFPLDWSKSLMQNMTGQYISPCFTRPCQIIFANISRFSTESPPGYGPIIRNVMMILGSGELTDELYLKILESFKGNSEWGAFVEELSRNRRSATRNFSYSSGEVSRGCHYDSREFLVCKFREALERANFAKWTAEHDFISPSCFLHLVERLLILISYFHGYFLTTKSSFIEWLVFQEWSINSHSISRNDTRLSLILGDIYNFLACIVQELLLYRHSKMMVLRSVVVLCLICVNSGKHFDKLFNLLARSDIASQLPCAFHDALWKAKNDYYFIYALADALGKIENPLVLVNLRNNFSKFSFSDAIFVSMKVSKFKEDISQTLFSEKGVTSNSCNNDDQEKGSEFWEILDGLELLEIGNDGEAIHLMSIIPIIKEDVKEKINLISSAMAFFQRNNHQDDRNILDDASSIHHALKQLSSALNIKEGEFDVKISKINELSKSLRLKRQEVEHFLDHLFLKNDVNGLGEASEVSAKVDYITEVYDLGGLFLENYVNGVGEASEVSAKVDYIRGV